jgi:hypothetical protein
MKNNLFKLFLVFIITNTISCSQGYNALSPSIVIENASNDIIYHVHLSWNDEVAFEGKKPTEIEFKLTPGSRSNFSFALKKKSHLYGPVRFEWINAKKEKIVKEIQFTKENLPDFDQKKLPFVNFYLTQDDLKMFVVPHGILFANEEERNLAKQAAQFQREYEAAHPEQCFKGYGCGNKSLSNKVKK